MSRNRLQIYENKFDELFNICYFLEAIPVIRSNLLLRETKQSFNEIAWFLAKTGFPLLSKLWQRLPIKILR